MRGLTFAVVGIAFLYVTEIGNRQPAGDAIAGIIGLLFLLAAIGCAIAGV